MYDDCCKDELDLKDYRGDLFKEEHLALQVPEVEIEKVNQPKVKRKEVRI